MLVSALVKEELLVIKKEGVTPTQYHTKSDIDQKKYIMEIMAYLPNNGTNSDVFGTFSATSRRKTEKERRTVIPSETFSPESGGR